MNFLKISWLVLGTVAVGGTIGTGIYYTDSGNSKNTSVNLETGAVIKNPVLFSFEDDSDNDQESLHDRNNAHNSSIKNTQEETIQPKLDKKIHFAGKIVFYKKEGTDNKTIYEAKLIDMNQYNAWKNKLNKIDNENKKVIDISDNLDVGTARKKLKEIAAISSSLSNIKTKISEKEAEFKSLLGETIYASLKAAFEI